MLFEEVLITIYIFIMICAIKELNGAFSHKTKQTCQIRLVIIFYVR